MLPATQIIDSASEEMDKLIEALGDSISVHRFFKICLIAQPKAFPLAPAALLLPPDALATSGDPMDSMRIIYPPLAILDVLGPRCHYLALYRHYSLYMVFFTILAILASSHSIAYKRLSKLQAYH